MVFVDLKKQPALKPVRGVTMRTPQGEKMMLSWVEIEEGCEVPLHSHPHEQVGILVSGRMLLQIGDEERELQAGDMYIIPGDTEHRAVAVGGPIRAMDVFCPVREDYAEMTRAATENE